MPRQKKEPNARNTYRYYKCVIGIDQSYTRTGITICVDGKPKKLISIRFKGKYNKSAKRKEVKRVLTKILELCCGKYGNENVVIICERIRTYTAGTDLRPSVIKAHSALVAYIVDTGTDFNVKTFSVDTRAWKHRVLGTSKPEFEPIKGVKNPQKFGSVRKAIELGFEKDLRIENHLGHLRSYDDDMADSLCISLYGFSGPPYALIIEE